MRVYLGSANVMLPHGEHTYELVYRTDRQMGFFADHDELYWNVTGNGWDFPIDRATARVVLPARHSGRATSSSRRTRVRRARKGRNYTATIDNGAPLFTTTRALECARRSHHRRDVAEGLHHGGRGRVGARRSRTHVESRLQLLAGRRQRVGHSGRSPIEGFLNRDLPKSNLPAFLGLFGLAALLFYYYRIWLKVGRDPPARITIPEYESPKGQSPASMRYLMRMGYDNECFAAAVLSLAVKGHLRIQQDAGILGIGKTIHVDQAIGARCQTTLRRRRAAAAQPVCRRRHAGARTGES